MPHDDLRQVEFMRVPDGDQMFPNDQFEFGQRALKLIEEGARYHTQGNLDAARIHYNAALLIEPENPIALQNLCAILFDCEQVEAAISVGRRAIAAAGRSHISPSPPFAARRSG